jgi:hypothetical protein
MTCNGVGKITLSVLTTTAHQIAISVVISANGGIIFLILITFTTFIIQIFKRLTK